jgi:hypothetical protein
MDFSIEDEVSAEFNMLAELPLNDTTSTTSHFDSIPQLCHAIGGRVVDEPCIDYILRHYPEQETLEDETCPPQHAARPPLSGLTNVDFSWPLQDFGASITPLAPTRYEQYPNDENRPIQVQQSQVCDAPHAFARLPQPQHGTAFGLAHSTNATDTQGAGSLPINLEDGENGEIDAGVHSEANGDDSDGDALSGPKSSPAETSTTYSEAITPYFSEPRDSPASSPPSEVAETQAGPTESSSLETSQEAETLAEDATDAQSTPSEEPSASTTAAEEPASSGNKTSSRKRRLSEAEDQPSKRPASESKVASNAVDDETLPVAYAAPPSLAPLPAASAPADTAAAESSHPTDEEKGLQEASETITTNEDPAAPSDAVSPITAASTAPPQILLSPSGHYASADADIGDHFDPAWLDLQLPVPPPFYHAANDGIYQPDAHGGMANYGPSGASGPTPTPALAQPVPIHATHGLANPIIPGNAPVGVPSFTAPPVSNPGSRVPPGKNQKQLKRKKAATTTKGKGRRGAGSNNNSGTPANEPYLGGVFLAIDLDSGSGDAELELPQYDNAGPSNGSTSNDTHKEKKVPNAWACYLKATGQAGCSKEAKAAWAAMSDQDREPYQRTSNKLQMAQFQKRAARRNAQSTPASSSSG